MRFDKQMNELLGEAKGLAQSIEASHRRAEALADVAAALAKAA